MLEEWVIVDKYGDVRGNFIVKKNHPEMELEATADDIIADCWSKENGESIVIEHNCLMELLKWTPGLLKDFEGACAYDKAPCNPSDSQAYVEVRKLLAQYEAGKPKPPDLPALLKDIAEKLQLQFPGIRMDVSKAHDITGDLVVDVFDVPDEVDEDFLKAFDGLQREILWPAHIYNVMFLPHSPEATAKYYGNGEC